MLIKVHVLKQGFDDLLVRRGRLLLRSSCVDPMVISSTSCVSTVQRTVSTKVLCLVESFTRKEKGYDGTRLRG